MMETWLDDRGFGGIETWAEYSKYSSFKEPDADREWIDEEGRPVDLHTELWQHICNILAEIKAEDWF